MTTLEMPNNTDKSGSARAARVRRIAASQGPTPAVRPNIGSQALDAKFGGNYYTDASLSNSPTFIRERFGFHFSTGPNDPNTITIAWTAVCCATHYKVIVGPKSPVMLNAQFLTPTTPGKTPADIAPLVESSYTFFEQDYTTTNTSLTFDYPIESAPYQYLAISVYSYIGNIRSSIPKSILSVNYYEGPSVKKIVAFNILDNISAIQGTVPGTYTLYNYNTLLSTSVDTTTPCQYYYANTSSTCATGPDGNLPPDVQFTEP